MKRRQSTAFERAEIHRRYAAGERLGDIAAVLGRTRGSVAGEIFRARQRGVIASRRSGNQPANYVRIAAGFKMDGPGVGFRFACCECSAIEALLFRETGDGFRCVECRAERVAAVISARRVAA